MSTHLPPAEYVIKRQVTRDFTLKGEHTGSSRPERQTIQVSCGYICLEGAGRCYNCLKAMRYQGAGLLTIYKALTRSTRQVKLMSIIPYGIVTCINRH